MSSDNLSSIFGSFSLARFSRRAAIRDSAEAQPASNGWSVLSRMTNGASSEGTDFGNVGLQALIPYLEKEKEE